MRVDVFFYLPLYLIHVFEILFPETILWYKNGADYFVLIYYFKPVPISDHLFFSTSKSTRILYKCKWCSYVEFIIWNLIYITLSQDGLDDESFENHRTGLIAEKLEKDPSLSYETGHHWSQIVEKRYSILSTNSLSLLVLSYAAINYRHFLMHVI